MAEERDEGLYLTDIRDAVEKILRYLPLRLETGRYCI